MKIILVEPNKQAQIAEIGDKLEDMQKVVGGDIEAIYPYDDAMVAIVCNDSSKLEGLPLNRALRDENDEPYDIIAGTFFIVGLGDEDFESIPDDLVDRFLKLFHDPEMFMMVNGEIKAIRIPNADQ